MPCGSKANTFIDSGVMPFSMNSYFSCHVGSALNSSALAPASNSLISAIRTENSGMNSTMPSGMMATPKFMPLAALLATESVMYSAISFNDIFLAATSSPTRQMLGCVCKAHSKATCDAERPMTLMKCQYFLAELASLSMLPMSSE